MARDYLPATIDQTAMPVRVEKWLVKGELRYRVVGVMWGGDEPTRALSIRFGAGEEYVPVDNVLGQARPATWGLWFHDWNPAAPGRYDITLQVGDKAIRTRRLDMEYYRRSVQIDEV